MKILILGSQGFIGSHLVNYFSKKKCTIIGCDLIEYAANQYEYHKLSVLSSDFENLFEQKSFDVCINASGSGNVGYSFQHPFNDFEANTIVVAKLLDVIRKHQADCKYVHISSAAVYGNPFILPINENAPLHPLSPYGWNKLLSEQIGKEYSELFELKFVILRPFSVYGLGLRKQLLWDICQKFNNQDEINLFGTGNESRDFIHIRDLLKIIDLIIDKSLFEGEIYNVANGVEIYIHEITALCQQEFKSNKKISFTGEKKVGDPLKWLADISKITELGYSPSVKIEEGISEYINWYKHFVNG